jgi:hypothetical protein
MTAIGVLTALGWEGSTPGPGRCFAPLSMTLLDRLSPRHASVERRVWPDGWRDPSPSLRSGLRQMRGGVTATGRHKQMDSAAQVMFSDWRGFPPFALISSHSP